MSLIKSLTGTINKVLGGAVDVVPSKNTVKITERLIDSVTASADFENLQTRMFRVADAQSKLIGDKVVDVSGFELSINRVQSLASMAGDIEVSNMPLQDLASPTQVIDRVPLVARLTALIDEAIGYKNQGFDNLATDTLKKAEGLAVIGVNEKLRTTNNYLAEQTGKAVGFIRTHVGNFSSHTEQVYKLSKTLKMDGVANGALVLSAKRNDMNISSQQARNYSAKLFDAFSTLNPEERASINSFIRNSFKGNIEDGLVGDIKKGLLAASHLAYRRMDVTEGSVSSLKGFGAGRGILDGVPVFENADQLVQVLGDRFARLSQDIIDIGDAGDAVFHNFIKKTTQRGVGNIEKLGYEELAFNVGLMKTVIAPADIAIQGTPKSNVLSDSLDKMDRALKMAMDSSEQSTLSAGGTFIKSLMGFQISTAMINPKLLFGTWFQPLSQGAVDFSGRLKAAGIASDLKMDKSYSLTMKAMKKLFVSKNKDFSMLNVVEDYSDSYRSILNKINNNEMLTANESLSKNIYELASTLSGTGDLSTALFKNSASDYAENLFGKSLMAMDKSSRYLGGLFGAVEKATRFSMFTADAAFASDTIKSTLAKGIKKGLSDEEIHATIAKELKTYKLRGMDAERFAFGVKNTGDLGVSDLIKEARFNPNVLETNDFQTRLANVSGTYAKANVDATVFDYTTLSQPSFVGKFRNAFPSLSETMVFTTFPFHAMQMYGQAVRMAQSGDYSGWAQITLMASLYYGAASAIHSAGDRVENEYARKELKSWGRWGKGKAPGVSSAIGLASLPWRPTGGILTSSLSLMFYPLAYAIKKSDEIMSQFGFDDARPMDNYMFRSFTENVLGNVDQGPTATSVKSIWDIASDIVEP